jgi:hypothetical protein
MTIPRKVVDSLADGADVIAAALTGTRFTAMEKFLKKAGRSERSERRIELIAKTLPMLVTAIKVVGPKLKELNEQARAQHQHLRAMLTQFKLDLEQGVADKVIRTQK